MIRLIRPSMVPSWLGSQTVQDARSEIERIVALQGRAKSDAFEAHWNKDEVRRALWEMHHHKCCYCERVRDLKRESDIEHYRPKAEVDGDGTHPGYWWLAYEWENLFFSCRVCNQDFKKNYFPVSTGTARPNGPGQPLESANRLLLHPCDDDPEDELAWIVKQQSVPAPVGATSAPADPMHLAFVYGTTDRGNKTWTTLGLNRDELLVERGAAAHIMEIIIMKAHAGLYMDKAGILDGAIADIRRQTAPDKSFLGLRRFLVGQAGLGHYLPPVLQASAPTPTAVTPMPSPATPIGVPVTGAPKKARRRARRSATPPRSS
jgi:uncharacterized protein (TIGR02646 family)